MAAYNPRGSASVWEYRNPSSYDEDYEDSDDYDEEDSSSYYSEYSSFEDLPRNCKEFSDVYSQIRMTLKIHVDGIHRIENPFLWEQYIRKKEEFQARFGNSFKEMKLFHATGQHNVGSIAEYNFDPSLAKRSKFGKGVSFSPFADYADQYCNSKAGNRRALILTRVLVGRAHRGYPQCRKPKKGFDTTTGNKDAVYVKYYDDEFYPEYVAYYRYHN